MKLKLIALGIIGAFAIPVANAGETIEEVIIVDDSIGATISAGYMTNYIFYGVDNGKNAVWTGIDYSLESVGIPIDIGVWYINPTKDTFYDNYDELDLYASYALPSFAGIDTTLSFLAYFYPQDALETTYELTLGMAYDAGVVDLLGLIAYDFVIEGWNFQAGVSKGFAITDDMEVVLSAVIGGQNDYNSSDGFWNDISIKASLPIALSDTATLEPYIGGLFALEAIDSFQDNLVHGGVSLSVSF